MAEREAYVPPRCEPDSGVNEVSLFFGDDSDSTASTAGTESTDNTGATLPANAKVSQTQQKTEALGVKVDRKDYATPDRMVYYICGACNVCSGFRANDFLRCIHCGGMTMYKPRVKKTLQYRAI